MKYEVTGDTIVIKYIADGKYKTLELNKNDNIDLDFFGQLIKAKNNKQDAMCDLYAKEVLSYDPSPERITNMNLTKIDEPSEYTKKEAAKLRIEELKRDLESIESEIEPMILRQYQHKKIEELKDDYLENRSKTNKARLYDLIDKYKTIKQMIDKEQKIYDVNTKKDIYTHDEIMKKISNEFESKLNKVVGNSDERRQIMDDVIAETTPKNEITQELQNLNQIIDTFGTELEQRIELNKPNYLDKKTKQLIEEYKEKHFCCSKCYYDYLEKEKNKLKLERGDEVNESLWISQDMFSNKDIAGYIYKITKKSTGEFYIGQTCHIPIFRWGQHLKTYRFPTEHIDDYTFEVLEIVPKGGKNILEVEKEYIQESYKKNPDKSLNISNTKNIDYKEKLWE